MTDIPENLVSFVEAEAANALNLPGGTVDLVTDRELARIGLLRVAGALIHGTPVSRAIREAGCFEDWLLKQIHRDDATGRVACWVTQEILLGRWQSEYRLLRRFGHTCNTLEHHVRRLRHLPEESAKTFFGVYDEYLAESMRGYDEKIRNIEREGETSMENNDRCRDLREQDKADVERWKSPGGWLWLEEHGFNDDPPNPVLLAKLEDGHYDEDLEPEEIEGWIMKLRERLEANPPSEKESPVGAEPPF